MLFHRPSTMHAVYFYNRQRRLLSCQHPCPRLRAAAAARSAAVPAAPAVHRWHGRAPREAVAARGPCAPVWEQRAGAAQGWCLPPRARWPRAAAAAAIPPLLSRLRPRQRQPPALRRVPAQRPARPAQERQPRVRLAAAAGAAAGRSCLACWAAAADRWLPGLRPWPAAAAAGLPWPLQLQMRQGGHGACIQCWLVERCLLNGVPGSQARRLAAVQCRLPRRPPALPSSHACTAQHPTRATRGFSASPVFW